MTGGTNLCNTQPGTLQYGGSVLN